MEKIRFPQKNDPGTNGRGNICKMIFRNLANVHNLLLRADAEQERTRARSFQREVRHISTAIVHHAALHIEQAHLRTDLCARNQEAMTIGSYRELRQTSGYRNSTRVELCPFLILADKHLLKFRNVVS